MDKKRIITFVLNSGHRAFQFRESAKWEAFMQLQKSGYEADVVELVSEGGLFRVHVEMREGPFGSMLPTDNITYYVDEQKWMSW